MKVSALFLGAAVVATASGAQIPLDFFRRASGPPSFDNLVNDGNGYLDASLRANKFQEQGQYSPRFTVPSTTQPQDALPPGCSITLVNSLERHGARYMTSGSLKSSKATIAKVKASLQAPGVDVKKLPAELQFLVNPPILNSTADLVPYGALQAYLSGRFTAQHYPELAKGENAAFIRTTGTPASDRVIVTSEYWARGFAGEEFPSAPLTDGPSTRAAAVGGPQPNVIISEATGSNNTLDVSTCPNDTGDGENAAIAAYGNSTLVPRIGARLQKAFAQAGAKINFTTTDITSLAALCPFETLSRANVTDSGELSLSISPYCSVLQDSEWPLYGYAVDAGKYYGSGYGDPYHRGVALGYLRELLARLTGTRPIIDTPSAINTTLDSSQTTFPTGAGAPRIFFDGSHDNNISPIVAAFGLFYSPNNLSLAANAQDTPAGRNRPWVFSHIAPLQGKVVFEKVQCNTSLAIGKAQASKEYVRVRANEAVQRAKDAPWCPATQGLLSPVDALKIDAGLCPLESVVQGLSWVKSDEEWQKCFQ